MITQIPYTNVFQAQLFSCLLLIPAKTPNYRTPLVKKKKKIRRRRFAWGKGFISNQRKAEISCWE